MNYGTTRHAAELIIFSPKTTSLKKTALPQNKSSSSCGLLAKKSCCPINCPQIFLDCQLLKCCWLKHGQGYAFDGDEFVALELLQDAADRFA